MKGKTLKVETAKLKAEIEGKEKWGISDTLSAD